MAMKAEQIRGLNTADIQKQLSDSEESMFRIRFQLSMGQAEGIKRLRELKKERARMLTVLSERANEAAASSQKKESK
jgi:large subunit ribosomal protein L29